MQPSADANDPLMQASMCVSTALEDLLLYLQSFKHQVPSEQANSIPTGEDILFAAQKLAGSLGSSADMVACARLLAEVRTRHPIIPAPVISYYSNLSLVASYASNGKSFES